MNAGDRITSANISRRLNRGLMDWEKKENLEICLARKISGRVGSEYVRPVRLVRKLQPFGRNLIFSIN